MYLGLYLMMIPVLIETLWNVNLYSSQLNVFPDSVLIETLWNVNQ